jgi:hypothetical protein
MKNRVGYLPRNAAITQGHYIMKPWSTEPVVQLTDTHRIQPRLVRLSDTLESILSEFPPKAVRPFELAAAMLATAISLESINYGVMDSVVRQIRSACISFNLYSSHGTACLHLLDLAEEILADLPIDYTISEGMTDD